MTRSVWIVLAVALAIAPSTGLAQTAAVGVDDTRTVQDGIDPAQESTVDPSRSGAAAGREPTDAPPVPIAGAAPAKSATPVAEPTQPKSVQAASTGGPAPRQLFYGGGVNLALTLVADVIIVVGAIFSITIVGGAVAGAAWLFQAISGPVMHAQRGRTGAAVASFALRFLLPAATAGAGVGIGLGVAIAGNGGGGAGIPTAFLGIAVGAGVGLLAGLIPGQLIDHLVLAREPEPDAETTAPAVSIAPWISESTRGVALSVTW